MSVVRHAGYLIKEENGTFQKHWCVVRDRAFLVYPFHENTEASELSINTTPIYVLPISHLSATAYALSTLTKRIPTNYSLELDCAATGRKFTFYSNQSVALERWVDAIKTESSRDYVTPQDSPHGALLPPEIDSSVSSTTSIHGLRPAFASQFGKETLSKKYLEHIKNSDQLGIVSLEQPLCHLTSSNAATQLSMQTDTLSLPDVIPTVYDGDISDSLTPLSSPTPSTPPSSCHPMRQESADESAFSAVTSTTVAERPQEFLRSSFTRQSPIAAKRGKQRRHQTFSPKTLKANSTNKHNLESPRTQKNLSDELASDTSGIETDASSSYFYTGRNEKKTEKASLGKQQLSQSASIKRHTIGGLMQIESRKFNKLQKKSNLEKSAAESESKFSTPRPTRHSIAPLSSLDMQINQRRSFPARQQLVSQQVIHKPQDSDSESEETSNQEAKINRFPRCEREVSSDQNNSLATDDANQSLFLPRDQIHRSTNHVTEADNSAVESEPQQRGMEMQATLSLARVMMDTSRSDDARKRSGNFGSRVINRVSSAVGKKPKAAEGVIFNGPPQPENTLSENLQVTDPSNRENKNFSPELLTGDNCGGELTPSVTITQGWLYKKKRMKWNKYWAVLSSDKKLYFYHDEQKSQGSDSSSHIDLQCGCSVENVTQAKSSNSFILVANTNGNTLQRSQTLKNPSSSPGPHGKRTQLMCKSTQEFVYWMKSFVVLNSSSSAEMLSKMAPQRTLNPIQQDETVTKQRDENNLEILNKNPSQSAELELNNNNNVVLGVKDHQKIRVIQHSSSLQNLLHPFVANENKTQIQKSSSFSVRKRSPLLAKRKIRTENDSHLANMTPQKKDNAREEIIRPLSTSEQNATLKPSSGPGFGFNSKRGHGQPTDKSFNEDSPIPQFTIHGGLLHNSHAGLAEPKSCDTLQSPSITINKQNEFQTSSDRHSSKIKSSICDYLESEAIYGESDGQLVTQKGTTAKKAIFHKAAIVTPQNGKECSISQSRGDADPSSWRDNSCKDCRHDQNQTNLMKNGNSKEKLHDSLDNAALQQSNLYHPCSCGKSKSEIESTISMLPFSLYSAGQNSTSSGYTSTSGSCISLGKHYTDEVETADRENALQLLDRTKFFQSFNANSDNPNLIPQSVHHRHAKRAEESVDKDAIVFTNHIQPNSRSINQILSTENQSPIFIIKQTDLLHIADNSKPTVTTERVCQALQVENDQLAFFLTPKVSSLRRSHSDSNILEPTNGKTYRMRTVRKPVPILTHIDFLEIYGSAAARNANAGKFKSCLSLPSNLNEIRYEKRRHSVESEWNFSSQKSDTEASSTSGSSCSFKDGSHSSGDLHSRVSRKSSESGVSDASSKSGSRTRWLGGIASYKIGHSVQKSSSKKASSKPQIFQIPASSLTSAAHCGYLDRKNRKKQWERFWCVFQDSCLYCYNSPQSHVTRDAVVLRGYEVIADVINMNRSRFEFRLEQQGTPTLHFSTDNHQEFLLWVGSLEREFRNVPPSPSSVNSEDVELKAKETNSLSEQTRKKSIEESSEPKEFLLEDRLDQEVIEMQKHQLLKEIATQQQKLLQENRLLSGIAADVITPSSPQVQLRHQQKRIEVLEKYNRQREVEEMNATKSMVLLNCRRNSAQLKVDQLAREIAPKSGKKRRQNHQHFAALEAKLNEMKEKLLQVDMEIQNLQVNKQNALEKIRERQDLELLLSEQQDALAIIRRHEAESPNGREIVRRRRRSSKKTLASIDEQHSCSTSELRKSASSDSVDSGSKIHPINYPQVFEDSSDDALSSSVSSSTRLNQSDSSINIPKTESNVHDTDTSSIVDDDPPSKQRVNKKDEIDPSIIAGIEDFEIFSKQMLEKVHNK